MAHLVLVEDTRGDVVDARYYCSDGCARTDSAYAGWNGCHDVVEYADSVGEGTTCESCGGRLA